MTDTPEVDPYRPPQSSDLAAAAEPGAAPPQRLGPQAAMIGVVALLCLLLFRLDAVPVVLLGLLAFADAWQAGIRKKPGGKGFLNISAAGWGVAILIFAVVAYPLYAFSRNRLRTRPGNTVLFVLVNVLGVLLIGLIVLQVVSLLVLPT